MVSATSTVLSSNEKEQGAEKQSLVLSGENLCYPTNFEFFQGHAGLFPGQPEPIHRIRFPKSAHAHVSMK